MGHIKKVLRKLQSRQFNKLPVISPDSSPPCTPHLEHTNLVKPISSVKPTSPVKPTTPEKSLTKMVRKLSGSFKKRMSLSPTPTETPTSYGSPDKESREPMGVHYENTAVHGMPSPRRNLHGPRPMPSPITATTATTTVSKPLSSTSTARTPYPEKMTLNQLEYQQYLVARWTRTCPGKIEHPQNAGIATLLAQDPTSIDLYEILVFRQKRDQDIERFATRLGLVWGSDVGIEQFTPPPLRPLEAAARRLLQACQGPWKEDMMPDGPGGRYRKPKYWIAMVAALNGWSWEKLDVHMEVGIISR